MGSSTPAAPAISPQLTGSCLRSCLLQPAMSLRAQHRTSGAEKRKRRCNLQQEGLKPQSTIMSHTSGRQAGGNYRTFCTNRGKTTSSEQGEAEPTPALHSKIKPQGSNPVCCCHPHPHAEHLHFQLSLNHPVIANLQSSAKQLSEDRREQVGASKAPGLATRKPDKMGGVAKSCRLRGGKLGSGSEDFTPSSQASGHREVGV